MRFALTEEHVALAEAIDDMVEDLGGIDVVREWSEGKRDKGLQLWSGLAEMGLGGLRVPEESGGAGGTVTDLVILFERLGFHAIPGPCVESFAFLPNILDEADQSRLIDGAVATASFPPIVPLAADTNVAEMIFVVGPDSLAKGAIVDTTESISALRTLSELTAETPENRSPDSIAQAQDEATLASAAYLVGVGERLLTEAVSYAGVREQFGRRIGEFQAIKHLLADVKIALTFARPLVLSASLNIEEVSRGRSVSAAKVAASSAANLAARASLQVHGAMGYTAEHHVGNWITLVPALTQVWGTPDYHRRRIARSLADNGGGQG